MKKNVLLKMIVFFTALMAISFTGCGNGGGGKDSGSSSSLDTTPDAFVFTPQNGVNRNVVVTSNTITVNGINTAAPVSISGANGTYSRNSGPYKSDSGTVYNGDEITVRVASSSNADTTVITTLNIGGVKNSFSVSTANALGWISVSAGGAAVREDGSLWTWGYNNHGQLGDGTTVDKYVPTRIGTDTDWASVSIVGSQAVAIKTDGSLWAWGSNAFGQIGDGTTVDKYVPTRIGSDTNWASVSIGWSHAVAIKTDGSLWAWGSNVYGQIGDGTTVDKYVPTRIGSDTNWASVAVDSCIFAIKTDGSLWAWGYNHYGQLGDGTTVDKYVPTRIGSDTNWASVSVGGFHAAAIKTDGSLWAWGHNYDGQLGDGTIVDKHVPTRIGNDTNWASVSIGSAQTAAIKTDGTLWVWEAYWSESFRKDIYFILQCATDTDWDIVSAAANVTGSGTEHWDIFAAIKTNGSLYVWGFGGYSGIGLGWGIGSYDPIWLGQ